MKPELSLENKVAIITGAAKGMGKSIAAAFTELGAKLALIDIDEPVLKETTEELKVAGAELHPIVADITDLMDVKTITTETIGQFGQIDILVNNAGVAYPNLAVDVEEKDWDDTLNVNLKGLFFLTKEVGRQMIKRKYGKIINIASQTGIVGLETYLTYAASKAGVMAITKVMALEWGQYNININSIAPTVVMTPLAERIWADKEKREGMLRQIPINRFAMPDDVASTAAFLASDLSKMITGTTILVDGGFTAR
jgi:NAD(P)-dependent dehydrogenase (short-subunit alcohol dehydrogenase family)